MSTTTTTTTTTREAAEAATARVTTAAKSLVSAAREVVDAINAADAINAWQVLGYKSRTEWVAAAFAGVGNKGDREALMPLAEGLFNAGIKSSRALAAVLGVSQSTASRAVRDLKKSGKVDDDGKREGIDGKTRDTSNVAKSNAARKGKGKSPKTDAPKTDAPKAETTVQTVPSEQAKTMTLIGACETSIRELSRRWFEGGDVVAEKGLREIYAALSELVK